MTDSYQVHGNITLCLLSFEDVRAAWSHLH
jgi:hypothetical protein